MLGRGRGPRSRGFLALLDDRLDALEALAAGGALHRPALRVGAADRALARRVIAVHEGAWDDGDENLVRGYLDRWSRAGEDRTAARARGLVEAAAALAALRARPGTLWFFLWEMESVLKAFADNPGRAC
jgi:hypothetical protein